jgi:hypothetical protein
VSRVSFDLPLIGRVVAERLRNARRERRPNRATGTSHRSAFAVAVEALDDSRVESRVVHRTSVEREDEQVARVLQLVPVHRVQMAAAVCTARTASSPIA